MSDLKEQIIESVLILFEKHGFHGITANQIIKIFSKSEGRFYHQTTYLLPQYEVLIKTNQQVRILKL